MPWREKNPNLGFRQPALNQAEILNSFQLRRKHLKRSWNVFQLFFPGAETIIIRWIMEYNIRYSKQPFSSILPIQRLRMYCLIAWFFVLLMERKWWILSFLSILFARDREREIEKKKCKRRVCAVDHKAEPPPHDASCCRPVQFHMQPILSATFNGARCRISFLFF